MNLKFPLFRKYSHDNTYFRINSKENFDELIIIGSFYMLRNQQANILPEYILIVDMIENQANNWVEVSENEYEDKLAYCKKELKEKTL